VKFAIPLAGGLLCNHFGQCQGLSILMTEGEEIVKKKLLNLPPYGRVLCKDGCAGLE
jgi:predicted Fe-Mo cluster-binding NifX family protein